MYCSPLPCPPFQRGYIIRTATLTVTFQRGYLIHTATLYCYIPKRVYYLYCYSLLLLLVIVTESSFYPSYRYYWSNMTAAIDSFVQTCDTCQQVNKKLEKTSATLHPISVDSLWHRIGIDLIGPFPRTALENMYIIICTDFFTKWPEASAIADKAALTVASFLFKLITRHGSQSSHHSV